jgi:hypothetical protein
MLSLGDEPGDPAQQGVLSYCWSPDVAARRGTRRADVQVGASEHPEYMPAGEIDVRDPDGYLLVIGQLSE